MLLSLDELAVKHGQIAPDAPDAGSRYKWQHRVADVVHGWTAHNYHHAEHQVKLSDDDYLAALAAAEDGIEQVDGAVPKVPDYTERDKKAEADAKSAAAEAAEQDESEPTK